MSNSPAKPPKKPAPLVAPKRDFHSTSTAKPKPRAQKAPKRKPSPSKAARKKTGAKKRSGNIFIRILSLLFGTLWRVIWWSGIRLSILGALILGGGIIYYYSQLPAATVLMDDRAKGSVTMLDGDGRVFAWRGDQFGGVVSSDTVSEHLKHAVIATEDKRFYGHLGISPRGIVGAIRTNIREGRKPWEGHGGSTITQQIAKGVYFEDTPGLQRKLLEVPMSMAMELKYTKDEILAIYLNRAFLGNGSFGFAAASQRYFGKTAADVTVAEAAMLAGLLKAPSSTNPIRNLGRAQARANLIVGLMEDQGYISLGQAEAARNNPAQLSQVAAEKAGGYFADWILEAAPEFIIKDANADVVIKTTFDKRIQRSAEEALGVVFQKLKAGSKAQGAIVVMSRDGAVRAMVGGRKNEFAGSFNRATQALRQTGSSFKPFVYAAALEAGFRYDSVVEDSPVTIPTPSGPWTPKNYSGNFLGEITMTEALLKSVNTVAVKVSEEVGRTRVRAVAGDFGVANDIPSVPSLALGAAESTLLEMTGAYAGILNSGVAARPYGLESLTIQGDSEPLLHKEDDAGLRVINPEAAAQLTYMMHQVVKQGTGRRADLGTRQAAGKTGTTNSARDAWFIGFTADYVAGVWMGYDDNSVLSGVTGGGMPADIWRETMQRVHEGLPETPLNMSLPEDLPRFEDNGLSIEDEIRKLEREIAREARRMERQKNGGGLKKLFEGIFN
ncbi:glycosyl transferase family 51 [Amylibacter marinus]|uniref:peptidoglycan glycosyltransferase n=1 Tax=Amylibacter marinus TaxID=1475483 RepID=A0ABQ5VWV3_9RHOB|nr:transglycosylase domain-containing protein [Amylibacter marinus]GLQ35684.1 glycosyl transferase family 51 [Amylibacter marinus]